MDTDNDDEIKPLRCGPLKSVEGWVVFVTNLHEEAQENDVTDAFSECGTVKLVKMNFDGKTGLGKGYALVEYEKQSEAQDVINKLHGTDYLGKTIGVHWAFVKPSSGERGATNRDDNVRR
jgi:RNA recognition motif-containing protein